MPLIETEEAARRLARAIASDLSLYNEDKIVSGIQNDNLFESLAEEIEEGRALYKRRVSPELYPRNLLRPRARRHPHQGQGAHQVEALVAGGVAEMGARRSVVEPVEIVVAREAAGARLDRFPATGLGRLAGGAPAVDRARARDRRRDRAAGQRDASKAASGS